MYIKLKEDMVLETTEYEPLYRGDNLNRKVIYLIPDKVGEIDILSAVIYLSYIRADGVADIIALERLDEKYKNSYYQYTFPVTCKLTKYPGEVCTWVQIYSGTPSNPMIAKSGECLIVVLESKNMDDYLCDHQVTALYQLQKSLENKSSETDEDIAKLAEIVTGKADDIRYDEENNYLQLTANGIPIGIPIDMESVSEDVVDKIIGFDDESGKGGDSDSNPDGSKNNDEVIHF